MIEYIGFDFDETFVAIVSNFSKPSKPRANERGKPFNFNGQPATKTKCNNHS